MPNPSNSDLVGEARQLAGDLRGASGRGLVLGLQAQELAAKYLVELAQQLEQAEQQLEHARDVLYHALPALGLHPRGFSQQALIEACELTGSDPEDWTRHPDVMRERRAALTTPDSSTGQEEG